MLVAGLITILAWAVVLYLMRQAEKMQLQAVEGNLSSVTQAIVAHSSRTLQLIDYATELVRDRYLEQGLDLDLATLAQERFFAEPLFVLFSVTDGAGKLVLSSQPFASGLDLSDREHIRTHLVEERDFLFVGRPVVGRVSGKPSIQFTRKILDKDRALVGIVVVSVDPYYFTNVYQSLNLGSDSTIELFRPDGLALAQQKGSKTAFGVGISNPAFFQEKDMGGGGAVLLSDSAGSKRMWVFSSVGDTLYVAVGLNLAEHMAPVTQLRNQMIILTLLLSMAVFTLAGVGISYVFVLDKSRRQAIEANRQKSRFISNVSHELRTPLNGILGYTELLQSDEQNPEHREFLQIVRESGAHLLSLVDSLLALNSIEKGLKPVELKPEPLRPLISGITQIHVRPANAKGLALHLEIDPNLPDTIHCDRVKLTQVLHNIIHNAVKYTDQGSIDVKVSRSSARLRIDVTDTGRGIAAEDIDSIFDTFYQINQSGRIQSEDGFGLGLPIVKQLTGMMQGEVLVISRLGRGTTFSVLLPLHGHAGDAGTAGSRKSP